eukprot:9386228-Alexandrium_andersonii.AAC.1
MGRGASVDSMWGSVPHLFAIASPEGWAHVPVGVAARGFGPALIGWPVPSLWSPMVGKLTSGWACALSFPFSSPLRCCE